MRRLGRMGVVTALALAACRPQETPQQAQARMQQESEAFHQSVLALERRYEAATAAAQADSITALFTEEGREMPPDMPAVVGRAAIKQYEGGNMAAVRGTLAIKSEATSASGPLGVDRGTYRFDGKAQPGAPAGTPPTVHDEGKYLAHFQNVNGQWLLADLIWNHDQPMMMPPAPPAKKGARP
jgi:ketosteroid isomerase-like protein